MVWFDQTSSKYNKNLFSRSAINNVKKFKYNPGKTASGEPISTEGVKVIIAYRIQGFEDNLGIDRENEDSIIDANINYEKKPYISIEDGSVFSFLDKRINCKPVFITITKDEQLEDRHSFKVVLLMSFIFLWKVSISTTILLID